MTRVIILALLGILASLPASAQGTLAHPPGKKSAAATEPSRDGKRTAKEDAPAAARCRNILVRLQLGEQTEADLAALKRCGS
jgi:hypothetical protein